MPAIDRLCKTNYYSFPCHSSLHRAASHNMLPWQAPPCISKEKKFYEDTTAKIIIPIEHLDSLYKERRSRKLFLSTFHLNLQFQIIATGTINHRHMKLYIPSFFLVMSKLKNALLILIGLLTLGTGAFAQTSHPERYKYVFTVAKDGGGDFTRIQDAIDAMRVFPLARITLYIKNGVYNEKIVLPADNTDVTFIGEDVNKTIIVFNDYSGRGRTNTFTSYTARISGNRFVAENITFANSAGPVGQALALYVDADRAVFKNCKFLGNQDTIYLGGENARQLFTNCYIEGTTDFLFGPATALFKNCTIRCKANSYLTAANTPKGKKFGFVLMDCRILADSSVTRLYLGRPWRSYSNTVFIHCDLPKAIAPEGWDYWGNPENKKTAFYAEYKNTGEGAATDQRASWSRQLTDREAGQYTLENIFSLDNLKSSADAGWFEHIPEKKFEWPGKT